MSETRRRVASDRLVAGTDEPQVGSIGGGASAAVKATFNPSSPFRLDVWVPPVPGAGYLNVSGLAWAVTVEIKGGQKVLVPLYPGTGMSFPPGLVVSLACPIGSNAAAQGQQVVLYAQVPVGSPPSFPSSPPGPVDLTTFPTPGGSTNFAPFAGVLTILYKGSAAGGAVSIASNGANLASYHYAAAALAGEPVGAAGLIVLKVPVVAGLGVTVTDAGGAGTIFSAILSAT